MKVKFKEKTYETFFQSELARLTNHSFAPDQTDEGLLGFDGSFYISYLKHPDLFPYVRRRRRYRLAGMPASAIDEFGEELNSRLPPFNLNMFIQYKRPEYMSRSNSAEWPSWSKAYYRFDIEDHQQKLLQKIADVANGRAAVTYASPAFSENKELFDHAVDGTIIENSNISDVALMRGHHRFSYCNAGHHGIGHSDPERLESEPLASIFARSIDNDSMPFTRHVKDLDRIIRASLEGDQSGFALWEAVRASLREISDGDMVVPRDGSWLDAVDSMIAFGLAFDVRVTAMLVKPEVPKDSPA